MENYVICTEERVDEVRDATPVVDVSRWRLTSALQSKVAPSSSSLSELAAALAKRVSRFGVVATTPESVRDFTRDATLFYVPGEFSRQADVLTACVQSGKPILVERGAFLGVSDLVHLAEKLSGSAGGVVETGSFFGYGDRVLDVRSLVVANCKRLPVWLNVSQLASTPGARYSWATGWQSDVGVEVFLQTGLANGVSGFVCDIETHPELARGGFASAIAAARQTLRQRLGEGGAR